MGLKENLPSFIAQEKYTEEILEAIEPEIDKMRKKLSDIILECCVTTCSEIGIKRFEADYSIKYNANLSLDERKKQVLNKMMSKRKLNRYELVRFIKRNIDNSQFYISNMAERYKFTVMLTDEYYEDKLYRALFYARPANLVFNITLVSYEKRCGTFRCSEKII